ncbi:mitochondrial fusion and transport protein ugo1 [Peltigera leucophlebia]|nr:mitochondrial fusion and transport protein ugo1 [Peltigera leucophlebia]
MEGPNPLRPYYLPLPLAVSQDHYQNFSGASRIGSEYAANALASSSFGSSARNILANMDYSEYLLESSPSPSDFMKKLLEQGIWKYTSIFLAQPFEVAKIILQVQLANSKQKALSAADFTEPSRRRALSHRNDLYESQSDDSDPDSPSYFTSSAPLSNTLTRSSRGRRRRDSPLSPSRSYTHSQSPLPRPQKSPHTLVLKSPSSLLGVLSSLWRTEGSWGIWKGTNCTYIHSILASTVTSFVRSFLSALLALPDPGLSLNLSSPLNFTGGLDILSSPSPLSSLAVAVLAAGISGILLAPLDITRIRLILTPSTHPPRTILATLNSLPSLSIPLIIAPVTFLHSTIPTFLSAATPLFLRSKLGIDPLLTPNLFTIMTFIGQGLELLLRFPVETVLRRGQVDFVKQSVLSKDLQMMVDVGPYKGLFGTMRSIVYEEGSKEVTTLGSTAQAKSSRGEKGMPLQQRRQGQGYEGLWRGWRVGMWGLLGVWGAATLGGVGGKGGEF